MTDRTNAIVEAAAEIVRDTDIERYRGHDGDDGPSTLRAAVARIRADLPAAIAAIDEAATPPAPLPDDVRRDAEDVRMAINRLFTDSDAGSYDCAVALDARHALDRIAARLNANGDSNDR